LAASFARMAATIERQAHEIDQLPARLDQFKRQSFQDPLTNLPNRALFLDRVTHGLARARRKGQTLSVLFIDLDRFKLINDSLGHSAGDQVLVETGRRLESCARAEDTVARLGGDEFGLLLEDVKDFAGATAVAERVAAALRDPFALGERQIPITASIGIALSREGLLGPEDLLRQSDLAMYRAKTGGGAHHEVFRGGMESPALKRLDLEIDLRRAVDRRELTLHYQPIVALDSGRVTGVEALIRWDHAPLGTLLPAEIIQVLEDIGLIVPVGQWVLREACREAALWQADRGPAPAVSVNLSVRQLHASSLVDDVAAALHQSGLKSERLKLEITESTAMADVPSIAGQLRTLTAMGIRLVIDDFGSGYAFLARLKHFPVEGLKIDRSLIRGIPNDPMDVAIVGALVGLTRGLKMTLTAEGVDTSQQALQLKALGCAEAQGYYFAPPLPADRVRTLLSMSRGGIANWASNESGPAAPAGSSAL
jgi:diguanylate cyclase (GGDEF)-like protein